MAAVLLALSASATWGLADFFGPLKGRTLGALARAPVWTARRPRRDRGTRRRPGPGTCGRSCSPGHTRGDLGHARSLRLLPRRGRRSDQHRRPDRGHLGRRSRRRRPAQRRPAVRGDRRRDRLRPGRRLPRVTRAGPRGAAPRGRRRPRTPGRDRLRLLFPADACRRRRGLLVGRAALPCHLDEHHPDGHADPAAAAPDRGGRPRDRRARRPRGHGSAMSCSRRQRHRASSA